VKWWALAVVSVVVAMVVVGAPLLFGHGDGFSRSPETRARFFMYGQLPVSGPLKLSPEWRDWPCRNFESDVTHTRMIVIVYGDVCPDWQLDRDPTTGDTGRIRRPSRSLKAWMTKARVAFIAANPERIAAVTVYRDILVYDVGSRTWRRTVSDSSPLGPVPFERPPQVLLRAVQAKPFPSLDIAAGAGADP
jgi:hypothetical protein